MTSTLNEAVVVDIMQRFHRLKNQLLHCSIHHYAMNSLHRGILEWERTLLLPNVTLRISPITTTWFKKGTCFSDYANEPEDLIVEQVWHVDLIRISSQQLLHRQLIFQAHPKTKIPLLVRDIWAC